MSEQRELDRGRYVLDEEPIASGGMGTVWAGYDRKLKRAVAVKELRFSEGLGEAERESRRARVLTEARAAARLDHPGIVSVYDVTEDDGRPWIVMRLVSGRSLAQEVEAAGPLSPRRTADVGRQLLDALSAAHAEGILHRDVKPQNVLLDADGRAVLTDFGIAVVSGVTRPITETGQVIGTLGYIAPERLSGAAPGPQADLWSLGATLYFAVEGRPAYDTGDVVSTIAAIVSRDPEPPRQAGPLAPVVAGLMVRDTDARWGAPAARAHLEAVASGGPAPQPVPDVATKPLPAPDAPTEPGTPTAPGTAREHHTPSAAPVPAPLRRSRRWAVGAAAVPLLAGGIAVGMLLPDGNGDGDGAPESKRTASPTPNRYTTAPKVCGSDVLSLARVDSVMISPQRGAVVNTGPMIRCEWGTDATAFSEEMWVRVLVHKSGSAAAKQFKVPSELTGGYATTERPEFGDQAELVFQGGRAEARVRISNLMIEVHLNTQAFVESKFQALVSELVAVAESEGD